MRQTYPTHRKKRRHRGGRLLLLCLLALLLLLADSRYRLVTTAYTVPVAHLPGAFDGYRILQLSDLHGAAFGRDNARLLEAAGETEPDLIVLTGDFIDTAEDIPTAVSLARELTALAPTVFISGNHDWASGEIGTLTGALEQAGVTCLHNDWLALEREGERLLLCGLEDPNSLADNPTPEQVIGALRQEEPAACTLLLAHRNTLARDLPGLDVDLILSGHAHGGVIRLPGIGGLLSTEQTIPASYDCGLYRTARYTLVVSRGLGSSGPVPRLLNNPELVLVTLQSEA